MKIRFDGVEVGDDLPLFIEKFDQGSSSYRSNDIERSQGDGTITGRDFLGGNTWGFSITTNVDTLAQALDQDARLAARWHDPKHRLTPLSVSPLSYEMGGRWRRVYGRPSRYAGVNGDIYAVQGAGRIDCDFKITDPRYFDEEERRLVLPIIPATVGGLIAPLKAPLSTVRSSAPRVGYVDNPGTASTPLKVVFNGPISNPYVRAAAGWEIGLKGSIAAGQSITVDAMDRTVLRGDDTPVGGMLTRKTRLSSAVLPTGVSDLQFGGTDQTGTASVELCWRPAYYSI